MLAFPQMVANYFKMLSGPIGHTSLLRHTTNILSPQTGLRALTPEAAADAYDLAQKYKLTIFFLSDGITKDELIYQRILEVLYPAKPSTSSPFVFFKRDENTLAGCEILDQTSTVQLARCI